MADEHWHKLSTGRVLRAGPGVSLVLLPSGDVEARADALADTQTLDGQATATQYWRTKPQDGRGFECARMGWSADANAWLSGPSFEANTPDEARAKAAAWVRSH